MIDHKILIDKLAKYDVPKTTLLWILDFITDRRQRLKLSDDCLSECKTVPAGVPQGTKLGPWLFLTMINDLDVMGNTNLWKYVDDSTLSEVIGKHCTSSMQDYVNDFVLKAETNGMQLKESKCKTPFVINDKEIEVVPQAKLMGLTIANNLKWNSYVKDVCKKVSNRLYF